MPARSTPHVVAFPVAGRSGAMPARSGGVDLHSFRSQIDDMSDSLRDLSDGSQALCATVREMTVEARKAAAAIDQAVQALRGFDPVELMRRARDARAA